MPAGLDGNPDPVRTPARDRLLSRVAQDIVELLPSRRLAVAVDGAPGAGKSTFADELARVVMALGREALRSTTDSFHNPRGVRYREGLRSARGYYRDSHNLKALRTMLLDPFRAGEPCRTAAFDEPSDSPVEAKPLVPCSDTVLVFDGLFLHRPELRSFWDYSVFLDGGDRCRRDLESVASRLTAEKLAAFQNRYVAGWQLYLDECRPEARATCVIVNDDFAAPVRKEA